MENEPEFVALDDPLIAFMAETRRELETARQRIRALEAHLTETHRELETRRQRALVLDSMINGALTYFAKAHQLQGPWRLDSSGLALVCDKPVETTTSDRAGTDR